MNRSAEVLAIILAGGEGRRLAPLTRQIAKPAIPFHVRHRLIDFVLSNLHNSGIPAVQVLIRYQADSVLRHLEETWRGPFAPRNCRVDPMVGAAGSDGGADGTASAVYQVRQAIIDRRPDVVAVFSADHVYRMDVRQMIDFHRQCGADATVAAIPVAIDLARSFGVMAVDARGRIRRFCEKPPQPVPMPDRPGHALASMGNYLFKPDVLLQALEATHAAGGSDFGSHLLPALLQSSQRLMAYDFTANRIDGLEEDCDPHYWRDVGTLDAYFSAHLDTMARPGLRPAFEIGSHRWPIRSAASALTPPARGWADGRYPRLKPAVSRAQVEQSVLRPGVRVGEHAQVFRCILGDEVEVGSRCRLRNVIVEAGVRLPDGFEAGFDLEEDRGRLTVSPGGVVVVPRGAFGATPALGRGRRPATLVPGAIAIPALGAAAARSFTAVQPPADPVLRREPDPAVTRSEQGTEAQAGA